MPQPTEQRETWIFERMSHAIEHAELLGKPLAEHDGYFRANNGNWIVVARDPDGESGGPVCEVMFRGTAKRGQTYGAPDPIGQARARLIAAAPDLLRALAGMVDGDSTRDIDERYDNARAALNKALGK